MERLQERLRALATEAETALARMETLEGSDDLSADDTQELADLQTRGAEIVTERADLETRLARYDELREAASVPENRVSGDGSRRTPEGKTSEDVYDFDSMRSVFGDAGTELRGRALKAVEQVDSWEMDDKAKQRASVLIERYDDRSGTIAKQVLATGSVDYKNAWANYITGRREMNTPAQERALQRAMSLTDSAGGFAVPFPIDPTLIQTGDGSTNPFRQISRVEPITTDSWQGISAGAISASWDGEAAQVGDDTPTWAQPAITAYKAQAFVPASIEVTQDYPNLAGDLTKLFMEGKDDLEATAFATGTGTNQPTGITVALTSGADNVPTSATTDVFAIADVFATWEAVPPKYRSRSTWAMNLNLINDIRQFGTAVSYQFTADLTADGIPRLMGKPVVESSAMDGSITADAENYVIVVGDFSNYVIADRVGFSLEFIPHLFGTANNRPTGQRGWYVYWRVGADSVNDAAFSMLNVT